MRLVENSSLHVYKPFPRITKELLLQIQTQNKTILRMHCNLLLSALCSQQQEKIAIKKFINQKVLF